MEKPIPMFGTLAENLAAYAGKAERDLDGLLSISRGTSVILLICYGTYLYFQLNSHAYLFEDEAEHEEETCTMNVTTAISCLVGVTIVTSFCADNLVGAIDEFAADFGISKA